MFFINMYFNSLILILSLFILLLLFIRFKTNIGEKSNFENIYLKDVVIRQL